MNFVSFPGLGIDAFEINPVAFKIFGVSVMWYGVIITCGMILAYLYGLSRAKVEKVKSEDITDLTLFLVIFGVIGARLYYIVFKLDEFIWRGADGTINWGETLKAMVNLRSGGLAIYGGIIAGFLTMLIVSRVKRIRFPVLADIVAPCLFIGQSVGRWGNFINVEAYGGSTELPWRMGVGTGGGAPFVHPTFLYESLWNLVGFILIAVFYKKKKFHGQVFLFYCIWYGLGRAWIEGLRTDSLMLGPYRVSQLLSIILVSACAVLMAICMKKAPRVSLASGVEVEKTGDETPAQSDVSSEDESEAGTDDEVKEEEATEETSEEAPEETTGESEPEAEAKEADAETEPEENTESDNTENGEDN
jgi:phosphatidylglycerol:prolipoprotein diacylglycerol transferase